MYTYVYEVLLDTLPSGRYPSDHFPISATFDLVRAGGAPLLSRL